MSRDPDDRPSVKARYPRWIDSGDEIRQVAAVYDQEYRDRRSTERLESVFEREGVEAAIRSIDRSRDEMSESLDRTLMILTRMERKLAAAT